MPPAPSEAVLLLAALLLAAAPLKEAKALRASGARVPPWVAFAVLTGLGPASFILAFQASADCRGVW